MPAIKTANEKNAQYPCKSCGKKPNVGDQIYIDKVGENWITCTDKECYVKQGGGIPQPKSEGGSKKFFGGNTNYKKPEDCMTRMQQFGEFMISTAVQPEIINMLTKDKDGIFDSKAEAYKWFIETNLKAFLGELETKK